MNIGAIFKKFSVIVWGALSYALTILPRILGALEMLGLKQWKETIVEGIRRGGMAADDYIEANAAQILHVADIFDSLAAWATERADLFRDIHEEGTKVRAPWVDDALTADVLADFVRRLLDVDDTSEIERAIAGVKPALEVAAAGEIRRGRYSPAPQRRGTRGAVCGGRPPEKIEGPSSRGPSLRWRSRGGYWSRRRAR